MPSSPNRRRIEIPAPLYDALATRAEREGVTVAALAARLLSGALEDIATGAVTLQDLHAEVQSLANLLRATLPLPPVALAAPLVDDRAVRRAKRQLVEQLRRERGQEDEGRQ